MVNKGSPFFRRIPKTFLTFATPVTSELIRYLCNANFTLLAKFIEYQFKRSFKFCKVMNWCFIFLLLKVDPFNIK